MATTVTSILRDGVTAAGVYPTLAAWRAALPANLVTADEIHILNVEAKAGGYTDVTLDLSGLTTDATHYIKIQAAAGHRHAGVWNTAKAMFILPTADAQPWKMATNYFYCDGMQIIHPGTTVATESIKAYGHTSAANATTFTGCIFKATPSGDNGYLKFFHVNGGVEGYSKLYLGSNLFVDIYNTPWNATDTINCVTLGQGQVWGYNNTFRNCSGTYKGGTPDTYQFRLKNNLGAGAQYVPGRGDFSVGAGTFPGATNNASSDGSAVGTSAKINQTFSFVGPSDSHLPPDDTIALGAGANLSTDTDFVITTDIDGHAYSSPWPIGADALFVVSSSLTMTAPASGRIYQAISGVANITVTGTYSGSVTALKARVVQYGTSTPAAGFDWATVVASPTGGTYSFTLTGVPKGAGWYSIQVQDTVDSAITITGDKVGVGELIGVAGQSNAGAFFTTGVETVSDLVRGYGNNFTGWQALSGGGPSSLGNALVTAYNCPIGFIDDHADGTAIISWMGAGLPTHMNAVGGKLGGILWLQGEADWNGASNYASYLTGLNTALGNFRTSLGQATLPIVIGALSSYTSGSGSDTTTYDQIKRAQYEYANATANTYIVDQIDAGHVDGLHLSSAGAGLLGARVAQAFKVHLGQATQYRGPSITAVNKVNATAFNVIVSHRLGSDLTPATQITGFKATDPGASGAAIAVTSALRQSATVIQLVLASAPVGLPVISYAAGATPVITAMARDNSALALPIEWAEGVAAVEKTASVNLVNASNAAQASLTGLKWAWFDQATPDAFTTPTDKGTGEITDGSGVLTVLIGNSGKTSGQAGWLIVTDSDGNPATAHKAFSGPVAVS